MTANLPAAINLAQRRRPNTIGADCGDGRMNLARRTVRAACAAHRLLFVSHLTPSHPHQKARHENFNF